MDSKNLSLQNLVEAIMNSVADAQDHIERQMLDNISQWFDEEGRPKMTSFKIPAFGPEADALRSKGENPEREIKVPLLTMMQNNPIKIKKLISKFNIGLDGIGVQEIETGKKKLLVGTEKSKTYKKNSFH